MAMIRAFHARDQGSIPCGGAIASLAHLNGYANGVLYATMWHISLVSSVGRASDS
jgi:hypothetical protein